MDRGKQKRTPYSHFSRLPRSLRRILSAGAGWVPLSILPQPAPHPGSIAGDGSWSFAVPGPPRSNSLPEVLCLLLLDLPPQPHLCLRSASVASLSPVDTRASWAPKAGDPSDKFVVAVGGGLPSPVPPDPWCPRLVVVALLLPCRCCAASSGLVMMPTRGSARAMARWCARKNPAGCPLASGFFHHCLAPADLPPPSLPPPELLPCPSFSPASSSSVDPFVSGIRSEVRVPSSMNSANICIRRSKKGEQPLPAHASGRSFSRSGMLMTWARMAPILPMAAETPWPVERYRVGKHSPGTINVVVFGPKLKKN